MPPGIKHFGNLSRKKHIFYVLSFAIGILGIISVAQSFSHESIWRKDFLEDYLSARAILLNQDPYQPLSALAADQGYTLRHGIFYHPNPHSPFLVILSSPYGLFSFKAAACLNLAIEICCLVFSVIGIVHWMGLSIAPMTIAAVVLSSFGWSAVLESLILGQTNLAVLALLVAGLRGLGKDRQSIGGIAIGGAIALKIIFWPLAILLLLYRKTKAFASAVTVLVFMHLSALLVLGFPVIENYYRHVTPSVASSYRAFFRNMSFWSVGWKLFEGTGSHALVGVSAPPFIDIPALAPYFSYVLVALILCVSLFLSVRVKNIQVAYAAMVSFSLLMTPLCWSHYLVAAAITVACAARRILERNTSSKRRMALYLVCACLLIPGPLVADLLYWLQGHSLFNHPLAMLTVSMVPMYGVLGSALLCCRCYGFAGKVPLFSICGNGSSCEVSFRE